MDQIAYVEISTIKNDKLYRLYVPFGVQWKEVREAALSMIVDLSKHIDEFDRQEKARIQELKEAKKTASEVIEDKKVADETNPSAVSDAEIIPE